MPNLVLNWDLVLVGFGIGALVGLTGVGGGSLMTPILIVVFRMPPSLAIGTDLFNAAITRIIGGWQHLRQGTVEFKIVAALALGSVPAAILGAGLVKAIKNTMDAQGEILLTVILAWTLIIVALLMVARLMFAPQLAALASRGPQLSGQQRLAFTAMLGLVAGFLVSLTSVGAGSIIMVFLVMLYATPAKRLVGTDILHAAVLGSVSAIGHLWAGDIDWGVAAMLLLGSVPGVLLGSRLSVHIPDVLLRIALALTLIFAGTRMIVH